MALRAGSSSTEPVAVGDSGAPRLFRGAGSRANHGEADEQVRQGVEVVLGSGSVAVGEVLHDHAHDGADEDSGEGLVGDGADFSGGVGGLLGPFGHDPGIAVDLPAGQVVQAWGAQGIDEQLVWSDPGIGVPTLERATQPAGAAPVRPDGGVSDARRGGRGGRC